MDADYLRDQQQNEAIPPAALRQYQSLVSTLNDRVMRAARDRLRFEDEPSRFHRVITSEA